MDVRSVRRVHDELVEKRLAKSTTNHKYDEERAFQLMQIEEIYNETTSEGMTTLINRLFNSFRELANNPSNQTVRSIVRENAKMLVNDIKRISSDLKGLHTSIDRKLTVGVEDLNSTIEQLSKINVKIKEIEGLSGETGDLRDQRDMAIKTIAEFFDIQTYEDDQGQFNVRIKGVGTIVSGGEFEKLQVVADLPNDGTPPDQVERNLRVAFKKNPSLFVDQNFIKGRFAALAKTKNGEIAALRDHIDTIAFDLGNLINAIHRRGYADKTVMLDKEGNPVSSQPEKVTGINFFKEQTTRKRAAEYIDLSEDIKSDLANIATALAPNSPGDNRVALAIAKLQHEKVLEDGNATVEEFYHKAIGKVGIEAGKAKFDKEQSEGLLTQANTLRERVSGVNIDEETANMVKYQHAYDASAKVLKTASEMLKSLQQIMS